MVAVEHIDPVLADLGERIRRALATAGLPDADPAFERPKQADHGDWASTVALRLAKPAGRSPRDIAQSVIDALELPEVVEAAEIAGPGFLNFRFAPSYYADLVRQVVREGDDFARRTRPESERERINVEFVSANPTGPLHVGAGRWAATGDALAELFAADGHVVEREYYVNDAGEQIRRFGETVVLLLRGEPLGDEHYKGGYMKELAQELSAEHRDDLLVPGDEGDVETHVGMLAVAAMRSHIEQTLHGLGVDYDTWFSELHGLHESGAIEAAIEELRSRGHTYEADGALFLKTEQHGDDKDRVLVRSDGRPTYFAADCAYLREKWQRADRLLYLLGADHHGYVGRLKAAAACFDIPADRVEVRIGQLVNLLRDGEPVKMSKRSGDLITLDEVVEEVGTDVIRYHFLRTSLDTMVDFDLAVVAEQSMENPVYYVQYAHARIASLVRTADERGFDHGAIEDADLALLSHPAEQALLKAMAALPETVAEAAELRATQRLARYAEELAGTFHRFYTECRVLVDDIEVGRARYWLAVAAKQTLKDALSILRVSAPERM